MTATATMRCADGYPVSVAYRVPGAELESTYIWVEGPGRVAKIESSWSALVRSDGFTVEVRLVDVENDSCGPGQVVLAALFSDKGVRIQGIAVAPEEWGNTFPLLDTTGVGGAVAKARHVWRWFVLAAATALALYAVKRWTKK